LRRSWRCTRSWRPTRRRRVERPVGRRRGVHPATRRGHHGPRGDPPVSRPTERAPPDRSPDGAHLRAVDRQGSRRLRRGDDRLRCLRGPRAAVHGRSWCAGRVHRQLVRHAGTWYFAELNNHACLWAAGRQPACRACQCLVTEHPSAGDPLDCAGYPRMLRMRSFRAAIKDLAVAADRPALDAAAHPVACLLNGTVARRKLDTAGKSAGDYLAAARRKRKDVRGLRRRRRANCA